MKNIFSKPITNKRSWLLLVIFFFIFILVLPVWTSQLVGGEELGVRNYWQWFGGLWLVLGMLIGGVSFEWTETQSLLGLLLMSLVAAFLVVYALRLWAAPNAKTRVLDTGKLIGFFLVVIGALLWYSQYSTYNLTAKTYQPDKNRDFGRGVYQDPWIALMVDIVSSRNPDVGPSISPCRMNVQSIEYNQGKIAFMDASAVMSTIKEPYIVGRVYEQSEVDQITKRVTDYLDSHAVAMTRQQFNRLIPVRYGTVPLTYNFSEESSARCTKPDQGTWYQQFVKRNSYGEIDIFLSRGAPKGQYMVTISVDQKNLSTPVTKK